jgi:rubrerythrin
VQENRIKGEFERVAQDLQFAIQMEIDGKQYYLKVSGQCRNEVGKRLLAALAAAEDVHRQKLKSIFEATRETQSWPKIALPSGENVKTIFADAIAQAKPGAVSPSTEMAAVDTAIGMEIASYDYYKGRSKNVVHGLEKEFYEAVAAEEHIHHMTLLDYKEYVDDPAAWFVRTEHPSFD